MKEKAEKVTEKLSDGERFFRDLQKVTTIGNATFALRSSYG